MDLTVDHSRAIEELEGFMLREDQVPCPIQHRFAPGVYMRECRMPAGTFVIGHKHNTAHFNIVLTGRAKVYMQGAVHEVVAPCVLTSEVGVRKVLLIEEEMTWLTVHPTEETNLEILDATLIEKSETFTQHELEVQEALRQLTQTEH